ncbi:hypothetical protein ABPG72_004606 [Tetrahymena utriculariae]
MRSFRILIVFLLLSLIVQAQNKNKNEFERFFKERQRICQDINTPPYGCKGIPFDFSLNCINKCVSNKCFNDYYGQNPLLPGEQDSKRERDFKVCVRSLHTYCRSKLKGDENYICIY